MTTTEPTAVEHCPDVVVTRDDPAARIFSTSIVVSGIRCLLTYVVFPWILPLVHVASGVGPGVGLVVGIVAIWFNVASIRRFWTARHPWRWYVSALNSGVIVLLAVLLVIDTTDLLG